MAHPDLPAEQAYLDEAYASLDRMKEALLRAAESGATEISQQAIEDWATGRLRTFEDADRGLCFGRIDSEEAGDPIYVGRRWVHDDDRRPLVVNWQTPAARPFYTATPAAPHGVTLRRRFRTRGRFAAATVHGTIWVTEDYCDRTVITVKRGVVAVQDLHSGRAVEVHAGHSRTIRRR